MSKSEIEILRNERLEKSRANMNVAISFYCLLMKVGLVYQHVEEYVSVADVHSVWKFADRQAERWHK